MHNLKDSLKIKIKTHFHKVNVETNTHSHIKSYQSLIQNSCLRDIHFFSDSQIVLKYNIAI